MTEHDDRFDLQDTHSDYPPEHPIARLIERSSFGTPEAKAARESVTDEQVARVLARAKELDVMHRAAQKMRDLANAVDALGELTEVIAEANCDEFADFISSWDPPVARAVADLLDDVCRHKALAVARAYLGETRDLPPADGGTDD